MNSKASSSTRGTGRQPSNRFAAGYCCDDHQPNVSGNPSEPFGAEASRAFDACERGEILIYVPTICLVEVLYLQEKGRIPTDSKTQLETELRANTNNLVLIDLTLDVVDAMAGVSRSEVPDMPDRIIAGTALYMGLPLISRDRQLQLSQINTIW